MRRGKSGACRNIDALSENERAVLDLWDSGMSIEKIARQLGLSRAYVGKKVSDLTGADDQRHHHRAMTEGNAVFLAALSAAGASS